MENIRLKRSSLYVSGANPAHMIQAAFYNEDCLVYDLEDSVPDTEKDAARLLVYNAIKYHRPGDKYIMIRVNGMHTGFFSEDLEAAVHARPDAIRIPKVENPEDVRYISAQINSIEREAGIEPGSTKLWCNIESYLGLINAYEIATADPRVTAMALGAEDFTVSIRARRTKSGIEILYARSMLLIACRHAGVDAIDAVFPDISDIDGLKEDSLLARNLGFDGKSCIHPRQVDIVNSSFTPDQKEIKYALRVIEAIEEGKRLKKGAVTLDGSMIDKPVELRARTALAQATAAGLPTGGAES